MIVVSVILTAAAETCPAWVYVVCIQGYRVPVETSEKGPVRQKFRNFCPVIFPQQAVWFNKFINLPDSVSSIIILKDTCTALLRGPCRNAGNINI
jgi:hypothetical protein